MENSALMRLKVHEDMQASEGDDGAGCRIQTGSRETTPKLLTSNFYFT